MDKKFTRGVDFIFTFASPIKFKGVVNIEGKPEGRLLTVPQLNFKAQEKLLKDILKSIDR